MHCSITSWTRQSLFYNTVGVNIKAYKIICFVASLSSCNALHLERVLLKLLVVYNGTCWNGPNCMGLSGTPRLRSLVTGMAGKEGRVGLGAGPDACPPPNITDWKAPKKSSVLPPTVGTVKSSSWKILTGVDTVGGGWGGATLDLGTGGGGFLICGGTAGLAWVGLTGCGGGGTGVRACWLVSILLGCCGCLKQQYKNIAIYKIPYHNRG